MTEPDLFIDDRASLEQFLAAIEPETQLALDTEFVREKTYYPKLCLVQIATTRAIACIDCLAIEDLSPLFDRLLRSDCTWLLHSGRQDLEIIYQHAERMPQRLIDTQIAAGLAGYPPQIGLQDLLADVLGVHLDKEYTRTDWSRRPLSRGALDYAYDDVRSLPALWTRLALKLETLGRSSWAQEDFAMQLRSAPVTSVELLWTRMKGLKSLDATRRAAVFGLIDWRERRAQQRDRPRRWIMSDEAVLNLARAMPERRRDLTGIEGLPAGMIERSGDEILAALRAAAGTPRYVAAEAALTLEWPDKQRLRELQDKLQEHAERLGIQPEVLATRQELADWLTSRPSERITETWRSPELRAVLGDEPERV
jgi:ribonuclease D